MTIYDRSVEKPTEFSNGGSTGCHLGILSQLCDLKVNGHFFAKAGKMRKRRAEATESSGKSRLKDGLRHQRPQGRAAGKSLGFALVLGAVHGLSPVIALSSRKKPLLRTLLVFQFTGTDW